ncbi:hypothetical protein A6A19_07800 [Actinobacillus delphinicola]|uniref:TIGR03749 family integrating conjugative element protein n=1 Tax=Actinobacillus delphinicola TaxID=51161 RepID=UPI00244371DB|nr:TIGR03749 family integrating conjugative element protein [Actinobacillus delphinicola]MDG6897877.1 hypothetical protein [Actinobacillus delphinicola]
MKKLLTVKVMHIMTTTWMMMTLCVGSSVSLNAVADEFAHWDKRPITVRLNVGQERIVSVGKNVQVGLPASINRLVRVQNNDGNIYFKASAPFSSTRVSLRDIKTGKLILLDVVATDQGKDYEYEPLVITYGDNTTESNDSNVNLPETPAKTEITAQIPPRIELPQTALPIPAALTRYAAQSLYAPIRTIEKLEGVHRVAMKLPNHLPTLIPNLQLRITPLESWGMGEYVVTAIKIQNLAHHKIQLDPRYLQGRFYAATFQHNWLGQYGTLEDTTVLYLVTKGKLTMAMIEG